VFPVRRYYLLDLRLLDQLDSHINKLDENNKNDELITTEKDLGQNDVEEKVLEKERDFTGNEGSPQTETVIDDKNQFNERNSEKRSRKQKKHRRNKSGKKNDERQSDDGEIHRRHSSFCYFHLIYSAYASCAY
jgi:hypothetical protein